MKYTLVEILEQIQSDIDYHEGMYTAYPELSPEWNFHLGWVDALCAYRWKLKLVGESE